MRPDVISYTYKERREIEAMKYSYWRSDYTGIVYEMPEWWIPEYGGWTKVTAADYKGV